jgi:putative acyl-CoA dehydrogenase
VICLDVLRAIGKEPQALDALVAEMSKGRGVSKDVDRYLGSLKTKLNALKKDVAKQGAAALAGREVEARVLVERMALALQASLLVQSGSLAADPFIATRLRKVGGYAFGTLPANAATKNIVESAYLV